MAESLIKSQNQNQAEESKQQTENETPDYDKKSSDVKKLYMESF